MKVLMFNTLYAPYSVGGAERVVRALATGLAESIDVTVVTLWPGKKIQISFDGAVKVIKLPLKNIYWPFQGHHNAFARAVWHAIDRFNFFAAPSIQNLIAKERPDVIHTHNLAGFSAAVWKAAHRLNIPIVHTIHDYYLLCSRSTMYKQSRNCDAICGDCKMLSARRRDLTVYVSDVIAVSNFVLNTHKKNNLFLSTRFDVIRNCMTHIVPAGKSEQILQPDALGETKLKVGFIGRIEEAKGIEALLDACFSLTPDTWHAYIAGRGSDEYQHYLEKKFSSTAVEFLGQVAPEKFFDKIDVLVVPSLWNEPLGMVAIEAYFHGVKVLVSSKGGLPELLIPGAGETFEPGVPGDLAKKLEAMQVDAVKRARFDPLELPARHEFEITSMVEKYADVYLNAVKQH